MAALSVRLPDDLDHALSAEAERSQKQRSELVRQAVHEYIQRQAKQRFMNDMAAEMRDWLGDESARKDSRALVENQPDDDLDAIIASEPSAGRPANQAWWK